MTDEQPLPRSIANAITGDRIDFLASPMLGDGEILVFRCTLPALADGAPLHTHDTMTESFVVQDGALEIDMGGGVSRLLGPTDELIIAPGTRHGFRNPLDRETRFVTTAAPGAELERFLRTIYAAAGAPTAVDRGAA